MEFTFSFVYMNLVVRGGCYSQVASISTDQSLEKLLVEENVPNVSCLGSNDEVAKIREKFDLAKQRFLKIPNALEKMPKMNPKGRGNLQDLSIKPEYLIAFTVGYDQKENIDKAMKKFSESFTIVLFHYDGRTSEWSEFEWSKRAIHISAHKQKDFAMVSSPEYDRKVQKLIEMGFPEALVKKTLEAIGGHVIVALEKLCS